MSDEEYADVEYTDEDLLVATQIACISFSGKPVRKIRTGDDVLDTTTILI